MSWRMVRLPALLLCVSVIVSGCSNDKTEKPAPSPIASVPNNKDTVRDGEALFKQYCASCHPNGGNVSDPRRNLHGSALKRNHITTPEDVVRIMRNPQSRMIRFDPSTLSDRDA